MKERRPEAGGEVVSAVVATGPLSACSAHSNAVHDGADKISGRLVLMALDALAE